MQTSASDALDLSKETAATRKLYGLDDSATKKLAEACLSARSLVERGGRFVQIWNNARNMHENWTESIKGRCATVDQPCAALVNSEHPARLTRGNGEGNSGPGNSHLAGGTLAVLNPPSAPRTNSKSAPACPPDAGAGGCRGVHSDR